jgi:hypothetical protein
MMTSLIYGESRRARQAAPPDEISKKFLPSGSRLSAKIYAPVTFDIYKQVIEYLTFCLYNYSTKGGFG